MKKIFIIAFLFICFLFTFPENLAAYNAPYFHSSSIVATTSNSDKVPADGKTDAVVTVTVKDAYGTSLAGELVSIIVTNDTSAIVSPTSTSLDSSGKAIFYIKSTKEGVDSLDILDRTQNVTLPGIGHVTFYSTTCTDSAPSGPPKLLSATPISNSQIKLTWTKAIDPVTYYAIYYGTKKGVYIYGNPNVGDRNTTSYIVGSLNANVIYYFIVIPGNGCTLGPISNELSQKAIFPINTPIPTQILVSTPFPTPTAFIKNTIKDIQTPPPTSKFQISNYISVNSPLKTAIIIATIGVLLLISSVFFVYHQK